MIEEMDDDRIQPKEQVTIARNHYCANLLMVAAIQGDFIKAEQLPEIIDLTIEGETRRLEWQNRSQANLHSDAENNLRAALGVAAVQIDDVMSRHFGNKPYADKDEERRAARCIVYMVRCAFAHNPIQPRWEVRDGRYVDDFYVPSVGIRLDTRQLHDKPLRIGLPNWFKFIDLFNYCANQLP